jgi:hypothetical protein
VKAKNYMWREEGGGERRGEGEEGEVKTREKKE